MFGDSFDSWAGLIALVVIVLIAKWLLVGIADCSYYEAELGGKRSSA